MGASGTDGIFACPERNGVQLLSKFVTTYAYELNDENAYLIYDLFPVPPYQPLTFLLGAPHFSEVPYLFDVFSTPSVFTTGQQELSETMISYWTHFAATGDPNSFGEPAWSPYSSMADQFQSFVPQRPTVEPPAVSTATICAPPSGMGFPNSQAGGGLDFFSSRPPSTRSMPRRYAEAHTQPK